MEPSEILEGWKNIGKILQTVLIILIVLSLLGIWKLLDIIVWIGKGLI